MTSGATETSITDTAPPPSTYRLVWAIRRDWAVDGTHEFIRPRNRWRQIARQVTKDQAFWRTGPVRPTLSIVRMSIREFDLHGHARRDCRAPDCAVSQKT